MIQVGSVIFHPKFQFHDGEERNKYLVVLGIQEGIALVAKTTSKGWRYTLDYGCQAGLNHAFFLPPHSNKLLAKPTWICFNEFYELNHSELINRLTGAELFHCGLLTNEHLKEIQECALQSEDISTHQENIISQSKI